MDDPANQIEGVIKTLTTGNAQEQEDALDKYFLPDAAFIHPYCYVPRFSKVAIPFIGTINSLWVLLGIYRWYRTMSPRIDISIDSTAFDEKSGLLYVTIRQRFSVWAIPFYSVAVKLVTVLELVKQTTRDTRPGAESPELEAEDASGGPAKERYFIASQEDLYQMNEALHFIMPGFGRQVWTIWQLVSTVICVILSLITLPLFLFLNKGKAKK
ncbi:hypothetical protein K4F52_004420 [Lecanicillium sp. MT-2017a]|nr:hypothetical protein K4F52_004420 [Lecanicillium sp. MT-2017a]